MTQPYNTCNETQSETYISTWTKRKKRSGQTYEETDRRVLRPEQANIGLHPWQLDDNDDLKRKLLLSNVHVSFNKTCPKGSWYTWNKTFVMKLLHNWVGVSCSTIFKPNVLTRTYIAHQYINPTKQNIHTLHIGQYTGLTVEPIINLHTW
jgi:hypothetical protein